MQVTNSAAQHLVSSHRWHDHRAILSRCGQRGLQRECLRLLVLFFVSKKGLHLKISRLEKVCLLFNLPHRAFMRTFQNHRMCRARAIIFLSQKQTTYFL